MHPILSLPLSVSPGTWPSTLKKLIATIKNNYCSTSEKEDDDKKVADTGGKGPAAAAAAIYTEVSAASTATREEGRRGRSFARGVDVCVRVYELSE